MVVLEQKNQSKTLTQFHQVYLFYFKLEFEVSMHLWL